MGNVGIDQGLKNTLIKLTSEKANTERQLVELKDALENIQSEVDDRKAIELNASELKRAKAKANPVMMKRLIQKLFSGIVISDGVAAVSYWKSPLQEEKNPNSKIKKAPELNSGAVFFLPLGKRKLVHTYTFENFPPLPYHPSDVKVMGGYILKNGGRYPILKEPRVVRLDYELTWMKPKIDLKELARLRESGLSLREIERVTKVGKTTVMRRLLRFYERKEKGLWKG